MSEDSVGAIRQTGDYGQFKTEKKNTLTDGVVEFQVCKYCGSMGRSQDDVRHDRGCPSTDRDCCVWCDLPADECSCDSTRYARHTYQDGRWQVVR